ncbi:ubiquitin carboxyl-terminal hydrolase isozyme L3-like, partial [Rhincodon typus]|uniref:ubiquitin carboxyl-terminal hydrolase isozyme L3-like n=1 Tax=Rhincodon typus TaxID=259920 RepID=UPI00203081E2
ARISLFLFLESSLSIISRNQLLEAIAFEYEAFKQEEEAEIKTKGQKVDPQVYFMKQTISNACGTVGLIHALANNRDKLEFEPNSVMKKFLDYSSSLSPEEKAKYLEKDESIRVTHEFSAQEGQTEVCLLTLPLILNCILSYVHKPV